MVNKILFFCISCIGFFVLEVNATVISLDTTVSEIEQGQSISISINIDEATDTAGVCLTLTYPSDVFTPDPATPVTSDFFLPIQSVPEGPHNSWVANINLPGKILLSGAYIDPNTGGSAYTGAKTLFAINFQVKADAPTGAYTIALEQTALFNPAAGLGLDVNSNGTYEQSVGDAYENVPILIKAYPKGTTEWNTPTLTDDFVVLLNSFTTNPNYDRKRQLDADNTL